MNENDNLERVQRYREILPFAYLAASIQRLTEGKKGKPGQFAIGMCARDIVGCEYEKSPAYRIAMAVPIPAEILKVEKETTNFGADYYHIWYRELSTKEHEEKDIKTPLLSDRRFGAVTEKVWGNESRVGTRMVLYKHNDPPKKGDLSSKGYRRVVYAEPLGS